MQTKINPLIAVAVGVVIIAVGIFFYVRSGKPAGGTGNGSPTTSTAYTNPTATNHP